MDIATVLGILAGFGCVLGIIVYGGSILPFVHIPSLVIVFGGTIATAMMHFSMEQVMRIFTILNKTLFCKLPAEQDLMQKMVNYSAINRRDGALALEKQIPEADDQFLCKGLQMIIDGQSREDVEDQMTMEIQNLQERHQAGKQILEFMGSAAPAFGMIGTLIGLIQMMRTLDSPDQIGAGMAVALVTTFYGAVLANVVLIPLAGKLGVYSKREVFLREMIVEGVLGIVKGQNPTEVREAMQTFVSIKRRENVKPTI